MLTVTEPEILGSEPFFCPRIIEQNPDPQADGIQSQDIWKVYWLW